MRSNPGMRRAMYYVIGDCHSYRFDGLTLDDGDLRVVVKARWHPFVRASSFSRHGILDEQTARIFVEQRFIARARQGCPPFPPLLMAIAPEQDELWEFAPRPGFEDAVLIFSYGDVDVFDLMRQYAGHARVELAPGDARLANVPLDDVGEVPALPYEFARDLVRACLNPLFDGLRGVRDAGFRRLFVLDLPPPPGVATAAVPFPHLHYGFTLLGNDLIAEFVAAEPGIELLDTWPLVTRDGVRDPQFNGHGLHLNAASAEVILAMLHTRLREAGAASG